MRVLQVFHKMDCGGAENFIMNVYRNIDRKQIQFDFIVHAAEKGYFDDEIEQLGGHIFYVPAFKLYNLFQYKRAWTKLFNTDLKEHKVIHAHMQGTAGIYLKIAKKKGLLTVAHSHTTNSGGGVKGLIKNYFQRKIRKTADVKLACGKEAGEWLYGKRSDFLTVHNGIDIAKFKFREETRSKDFTVISVANFYPVKNHSFLIDIFSELVKLKEESKLLLVGDGVLRTDNQKKVTELGLDDKVSFLGIRNDIDRLLQTADVFCMPSLYEGLPVSLIEAQASGLPVRASTNVSPAVSITDLVKFIELDQGAEVWAKELLQSTTKNREDYAAQVAKMGYDAKQIAELLVGLYNQIN